MSTIATQPKFVKRMNYWSWDVYQIALEFTPDETHLWSTVHEDDQAVVILQYLAADTGNVVGSPFYYTQTIDLVTAFIRVKNFASLGDLMVSVVCDDYGDSMLLITATVNSAGVINYKAYEKGWISELSGLSNYCMDLQIKTETNYLFILSTDDSIVLLGSIDSSQSLVTITF